MDVWASAEYPRAKQQRRGTHWLMERLARSAGHLDVLRARHCSKEVPLWNGKRMRVIEGDYVSQVISQTGGCEPETTAIFQKLLQPGAIVFDVGANLGYYTLVEAGLAGPNGRVHSFEPNPAVCGLLRESVRLNALRNVTVNEAGVSEAEGRAKLYVTIPEQMSMASLRPPRQATTGKDVGSGLTRTIRLVCLDDYIEHRGIARIDLIKMDVEGAEMKALRGAQRLLGRQEKPVIIMEFNAAALGRLGSSCSEVARFLLTRDFSLYRVLPGELEPYESGVPKPYFNVLAVPNRVRESILERVSEPVTAPRF